MQKALIGLFLSAACVCSAWQTTANDTATEQNVHGTVQGIIASHGVSDGFFMNGSFLFYKPIVDNLAYVSKNVLNFSDINNNTIELKSSLKEPHFQWSLGGTLELGYIFKKREQWKLSLAGTHFESNAKDSITQATSDTNTQLMPVWAPNIMGQLLSKASTKWHLNFNTLDLDLARDFFISKWISVQPFFGLRAAWILQKYKVNYGGLYDITIPNGLGGFIDLNFSHDNHIVFRNNYRGFGFRFGTDFLVHLTKNFGIIGDISGSLLYGLLAIERNTTGAFPSDDLGPNVELLIVNSRFSKKFHRLRSNIETQLGLQWEQFFNKEKNRFILSASYAYSIWFNQVELYQSFASPSPDPVGAPNFPAANIDPNYQVITRDKGDLQFHGVVLKAGFDF